MTDPRVRVILIEDHGVVREGLRLLLEHTQEITVVGEAATGTAGVTLFERLSAEDGVDVVVTDLGLPDIDGVEVTRRIKARCANARILVLTMQIDDNCIHELLELGVDGYLLKYVAGQELVDGIRSVARGETVLSPQVIRRLITRLNRNRERDRYLELLTPRDLEILKLLAAGSTSKEAALVLGIRTKTVENHRARILERLNATNTAAAINFAFQQGLLPPN